MVMVGCLTIAFGLAYVAGFDLKALAIALGFTAATAGVIGMIFYGVDLIKGN